MKVLFLKQQVGGGAAIENFIESAMFKKFGSEAIVYNVARMIRGLSVQYPSEKRNILASMSVNGILKFLSENEVESLFFINGYYLELSHQGFLELARKYVKKIISWQTDDPYYIDLSLPISKFCDFTFTVDRASLDEYDSAGFRAEFLPLACDPLIHKKYQVEEKYDSDICFVGVPFKASKRVALIDSAAHFLAMKKTRIIGTAGNDTWKTNLINYPILKDSISDNYITQEEAVKYYNGSKICLNIHKDSYGHIWDRNKRMLIADSPNERTFAIAGSGACQLADDSRPVMSSMFEPDKEIILFKDAHDMRVKLEYFLQNNDERLLIGEAARHRALKDHTYSMRMERIAAEL